MNICELPNEMLLNILKYSECEANKICMRLNRRLEKVVRIKKLHKETMMFLQVKSYGSEYLVHWVFDSVPRPDNCGMTKWSQDQLEANLKKMCNYVKNIQIVVFTGISVTNELLNLIKSAVKKDAYLTFKLCNFEQVHVYEFCSFVEAIQPWQLTVCEKYTYFPLISIKRDC